MQRMDWRQGEKELIRDFVNFIDTNFVEDVEKKIRFNIRGPFNPSTKFDCLLHGMRQDIFDHLRDGVVNRDVDSTWEELVEAAEDAESLSFLYKTKQSTKVGPKYSQRNNFQVDEDGYVVVYTDGACLNNGQSNPKAGVGVWFGSGHQL